MNKSKKTKLAPKAKARKAAVKTATKKKAAPKKAAIAAPLEKNGFMWKLLERKEAELKAKKFDRVETPYENRYNHYNPQKKKTG